MWNHLKSDLRTGPVWNHALYLSILVHRHIREAVKNRKAIFLKGLKMMFLYQTRLKIDQNGHIIDQKGLKNVWKKAKNGVFGPKITSVKEKIR